MKKIFRSIWLALGGRGRAIDFRLPLCKLQSIVDCGPQRYSAGYIGTQVCLDGRDCPNSILTSSYLANGCNRQEYQAVHVPIRTCCIKEDDGRVGSVSNSFEDGLRTGNAFGFIGHDGLPRFQVMQDGIWLVLTEAEYWRRRASRLAEAA